MGVRAFDLYHCEADHLDRTKHISEQTWLCCMSGGEGGTGGGEGGRGHKVRSDNGAKLANQY